MGELLDPLADSLGCQADPQPSVLGRQRSPSQICFHFSPCSESLRSSSQEYCPGSKPCQTQRLLTSRVHHCKNTKTGAGPKARHVRDSTRVQRILIAPETLVWVCRVCNTFHASKHARSTHILHCKHVCMCAHAGLKLQSTQAPPQPPPPQPCPPVKFKSNLLSTWPGSGDYSSCSYDNQASSPQGNGLDNFKARDITKKILCAAVTDSSLQAEAGIRLPPF